MTTPQMSPPPLRDDDDRWWTWTSMCCRSTSSCPSFSLSRRLSSRFGIIDGNEGRRWTHKFRRSHQRNESTDTAKTSSSECDALISNSPSRTNNSNIRTRAIVTHKRTDVDIYSNVERPPLRNQKYEVLSDGNESASHPRSQQLLHKRPPKSIFKPDGIYSQKKHHRRGIIHQFSTVTLQRLQFPSTTDDRVGGKKVSFPSDNSKLCRVRSIPHHSTWTNDYREAVTYCYPKTSWQKMLRRNANQHRLEKQLRQLDEPNPEEFLEMIETSCSSIDYYNGDRTMTNFAGGFLEKLDGIMPSSENRPTEEEQEEEDIDDDDIAQDEIDRDRFDQFVVDTLMELQMEKNSNDVGVVESTAGTSIGNLSAEETRRRRILPETKQRISWKTMKTRTQRRSHRKTYSENDLPGVANQNSNNTQRSMFDLIITNLEN